MDVLVKYLCKYSFIRLRSSLESPVVIHSVPGSGKSSLIREIIREDRRFGAITYGEPDTVDLTGRQIQSAEDAPICEFLLVDEYLNGPWIPNAFAVFADPLQGGTIAPKPADFICRISRRFGHCTAHLLQELGFDVQACGEDAVQVCDIYQVDPRDTIIFYEEEVATLLSRHNVQAYCVNELRGKTFESVTFVTSNSHIPPDSRADVFQALTRHRTKLLILCPNATFAST
uniref:Triple gene block 1 n=1 Tax=Pitahaya virus E TaxID=3144105 RepID=A0AAU6WKX6_9VIRU